MNVTVEFADEQHPGARSRGIMEELRVACAQSSIELGAEPVELTEQLVVLVDGAFSSAQCFGRAGPHRTLVDRRGRIGGRSAGEAK